MDGIYKNRVKKDSKKLEIPTLLSSKRGNSECSGKIQHNMHHFEFSHSAQRVGISKFFQSFFTLFFYIPWILVKKKQHYCPKSPERAHPKATESSINFEICQKTKQGLALQK